MRLFARALFVLTAGALAAPLAAEAACQDPGARAAFAEGGYFAPPTPMSPASKTYVKADGSTGSLDEFKGKPVMVSFWATWCGGCAVESDALNRLIDAYKEKGIVFLPLSIDKGARPEAIRGFLDRKNHPAIAANLDPGARLFEDLCLAGTPSHAILDREGRLVELFVGAQPWDSAGARKYINDVIQRP